MQAIQLPQIFKETITTAVGGSGSATISDVVGYVDSITYVKTDYTNGVDFVIKNNDTGEAIWAELNVNATETVRPRRLEQLAGDGSDLTTHDRILLAGEDINIAVTSGGDAKTGQFIIRVVPV